MADAKKEKEEPAEKAEGAEGAAAEGGEEGKKGGKKKLILIAAAAVILLAGGGAGLFFSGILGGKDKGGEEAGKETAAAGEHGGEKAPAGKEKDKGGNHGTDTRTVSNGNAFFLQIPNMLVNLSTTDGPPRYLRLSVQLELASEADTKAVEAVMPRVVDEFQTYLRELRVKDLRGSAGIYRLQMELLSRVNAAAYPTEVKDVLFQEILIQ